MKKTNVTIEIEAELKEKAEEIAGKMGISVADWCALAITQQLNMQESLEDLLLHAGHIGFNLEEIDFESITNQLFSSISEVETTSDDSIEIIVPEFFKKKDYSEES